MFLLVYATKVLLFYEIYKKSVYYLYKWKKIYNFANGTIVVLVLLLNFLNHFEYEENFFRTNVRYRFSYFFVLQQIRYECKGS